MVVNSIFLRILIYINQNVIDQHLIKLPIYLKPFFFSDTKVLINHGHEP